MESGENNKTDKGWESETEESYETSETEESVASSVETQKTVEIVEIQEKENFDHLSLQDLNNEEVKTLTKHVFKEFFNSFLHLAAEISSDANEEPSEDRLNIFTEETFNAKSKKLEEKLN